MKGRSHRSDSEAARPTVVSAEAQCLDEPTVRLPVVGESWDEVPLHQIAATMRRPRGAWSFAMLFAGGAALAGCSAAFGPTPGASLSRSWGTAPDHGMDSAEPEPPPDEDDGADGDRPDRRPHEPDEWGSYDGASGGHGGDDDTETPEAWGPAVVTLYTFQDNSACNSMMTATGRPLVPYVSVALPSRLLTDRGGGPFSIGETVHVAFLEGRTMPDGRPHSGWVRIDDYCGDHGDDSYCLQGGLPNVDLYVGDWATSGMSCDAQDLDDWASGGFSGPGGDGQEPTTLSFGPAPAGLPVADHGGSALGEGDCGDCPAARRVQPPACWHYDPGDTNVRWCDCDNSNGRDGQCG